MTSLPAQERRTHALTASHCLDPVRAYIQRTSTDSLAQALAESERRVEAALDEMLREHVRQIHAIGTTGNNP